MQLEGEEGGGMGGKTSFKRKKKIVVPMGEKVGTGRTK